MSEAISCLKLYAAPLVVLVDALLVLVVGGEVWAIAMRLVLLAVGLAVSIRERSVRERRRR